MRDPRHPRHFTDEFKRQIVELYNVGKPKREIMEEYNLGKSTVERWVKSINATGSPHAADNRMPEQNRIIEPGRENRRLRMEVDVLKQAALIYARRWGHSGRGARATPYQRSAGSSASRGRRTTRCAGGWTSPWVPIPPHLRYWPCIRPAAAFTGRDSGRCSSMISSVRMRRIDQRQQMEAPT